MQELNSTDRIHVQQFVPGIDVVYLVEKYRMQDSVHFMKIDIEGAEQSLWVGLLVVCGGKGGGGGGVEWFRKFEVRPTFVYNVLENGISIGGRSAQIYW